MENKITGKNWWEMTEEELNELHKKLWRNPEAVEQSQEDKEIRPKIIPQEDYQKTRLYKLADEYVDEYFDYKHLRTIESLYGSERANETVRSHIRDAYGDGYKDALRDVFIVLKQFKGFDGMSFETFKKELVNPKKGNSMLDQIHDEQNKRCCQNCKNFVPFNHDCLMRGYDMYRCIDHDFKDFEAK